ncbi:hypothetical protein [Alkalicoccus daliensis]|uniref:ABC-2 type transport system permease protein n=1 Tax=Alkalicoccus daliensis TaxID=745820 RepID=A0A1H0ICA2_9BACI|nr:hypothetical protein [Alkalicoccus daliensis]SDO28995.1 ABC-2 type transport system permease protein [Alkalicoccus daliensis]
MFEKGLWFQNYKQSKFIIWILLVLFVLQMPLQAILSLETWTERAEQAAETDEYVYEVQAWDINQIFSQGMFTVFVAVALVLLASLLIGLERNTRRNDFTFSLPYKRSTLFYAKWALGVTVITGFFALNYIPSYIIIHQSEFAYGLNLVSSLEIFWAPLLGYIFFYTFALLIGAITGEMVSQVVLTFLLGFLPLILLTLFQEFMQVHDFFFFSIGSQPRFITYLTPFYYTIGEMGEMIGIFLAVLFTIICTLGGAALYERNKIEYNGEFLIFKQLNPVFIVILTIIIALFGGLIVSSLAPWGANALRIISYWIGFSTFLLFALLLIRRLIIMNITFSGKPT